MFIRGRKVPNDSFIRVIPFGLAGGLLGTILMDVVMVLTFIMTGQPADAFFSMVGEKFSDGPLVGIAVHNMVGLTGGFVFSLLVVKMQALRIDSRRKGLELGIAAGALTIPLGCIPLAIWLGQPIVLVIAFSMLPHLVWGTVLGLTIGYGIFSYRGGLGNRRSIM
jgi:hypothetical protein